jgi:4-amino-4-deoxy-L-arabinose transferase-like glycosyltransferase
MSYRYLWFLYSVAVLSFVPHFFQQHVGEEAVYTLIAQEMWASGDYLTTTLYGQTYGRPGLFAWLTIPLVKLLGWENVLLATRLIAVSATTFTGLVLAWVVYRLSRDSAFAAFAALVYLSGDTLFFRGWLAYSDPCYALFIFTAMACLWIAADERRNAFLIFAALAITAAVLTKTLTAYGFYGVLAIVLLLLHPNRSFLLRPASIAIHGAAAIFPFAYDFAIQGQSIVRTFESQAFFELANSFQRGWLIHVLGVIFFPLYLIRMIFPISGFAVYSLWRDGVPAFPSWFRIAFWISLIGILPTWITVGSHRHLMPVLPFIAMCAATIVWHAQNNLKFTAARATALTVAAAYLGGLLGYPYYDKVFRGSYLALAQQIVARTGDAPIYSVDSSSLGLILATNINQLRGPNVKTVSAPKSNPPGFILTADGDGKYGKVTLTVRSGKQARYLHCYPVFCP